MSYVAERRGGGPQDLLRGFESFRSCKKTVIVFYGKEWLDLWWAMYLHRPFFVSRQALGRAAHPIDRICIAARVDGHGFLVGQVGDKAGHIIRAEGADGVIARL